jgi:predicted alpha/beta-hydrolase family hydrolase
MISSFGGRMTSQSQAEASFPGVKASSFGFPLHAIGNPSNERAAYALAEIPILTQ